MISNFLIKYFIKDYKNTTNKIVRQKYGYLGGIVGLISNLLLFIMKLSVGLISNSIAVIADAFNNLSDSASSLITIISFKISNKPADKEHPFGHGRIEYISALIVSFLVMMVGLEFIKTSFKRILNPEPIKFQLIPFILIIISIFIKVWLSKFNNLLGKSIESNTLQASSIDALSDVITSSVVALSFLISNWTSIPIDGYIGLIVALFILYSGFSLIKETINPLMGEAPDPNFASKIQEDILKYPNITGVHDLIIHNYGPSKYMVSLHAEVPCDIPILEIHEIIDTAEREISEKHDILLVIHMDPINTNDKEVEKAKKDVKNVLINYSKILSMHDFRIVGENDYINLIFDIVIPADLNLTTIEEKTLIHSIEKDLKKINPGYNTVITVDKDFNYTSQS